MYVSSISRIKDLEVKAPGASQVLKKVLVGPKEGWDGWVMRLFTLKPGGHTPKHTHPWPHINYVTQGKGTLFAGGRENAVEAGSVAYVPADIEHQFINSGQEDFAFICIVPEEGDI